MIYYSNNTSCSKTSLRLLFPFSTSHSINEQLFQVFMMYKEATCNYVNRSLHHLFVGIEIELLFLGELHALHFKALTAFSVLLQVVSAHKSVKASEGKMKTVYQDTMRMCMIVRCKVIPYIQYCVLYLF